MELRQLRYFVMAAREGNFTRAAERLFMAQPPLSLQIQKLEEELGVRLFERVGRGVVLTAAGRAFLGEAERILAELDAAIQGARDLDGARRGTLAVGAVPVLAATVLPPALAALRRRLPGIDFQIHEGNPVDVAERVRASRASEAEVGFVPLPTGLPELEEMELWEDGMVLVAPRDHRLAGSRQVRLAELASEPFIFTSRRRTPILFIRTLEACRAAGFEPQVVCRGPGPHLIVRLVEAGIGISILPRISLHMVRGASVSLIPLSDPGLTARYGLIRRRTGYLSSAAKGLIAIVSDPEFLRGIGVGPLTTAETSAGSNPTPMPDALRQTRRGGPP